MSAQSVEMQLTSVRLSKETIESLQLIAGVKNTSFAEVIRQGLSQYIDSQTSSSEFASGLESKQREREALIERLLAGANRD